MSYGMPFKPTRVGVPEQLLAPTMGWGDQVRLVKEADKHLKRSLSHTLEKPNLPNNP